MQLASYPNFTQVVYIRIFYRVTLVYDLRLVLSFTLGQRQLILSRPMITLLHNNRYLQDKHVIITSKMTSNNTAGYWSGLVGLVTNINKYFKNYYGTSSDRTNI